MKNLFLLIIFLINYSVYAQDPIIAPPANNEEIQDTENIVYTLETVDIQPEFYGGMDAFDKFIKQNFVKPEVPNLIGKVFVSFIIEKDGTLSEIKVIKDAGFGTAKEALRVMQLSPSWKPAKLKGNVIRVSYIAPIIINTP